MMQLMHSTLDYWAAHQGWFCVVIVQLLLTQLVAFYLSTKMVPLTTDFQLYLVTVTVHMTNVVCMLLALFVQPQILAATQMVTSIALIVLAFFWDARQRIGMVLHCSLTAAGIALAYSRFAYAQL